MSDNQKEPQYKLRWNEELRDKVMVSAKENNRSINQEIISRLEQSFTDKNIAEEEVVALTSQVRQLLNRIEGGKLQPIVQPLKKKAPQGALRFMFQN